MEAVHVIGGGLSGVEAAWAAARLGVQVHLWEMRPARMTPAHRTGQLAELVCSNSFGGEAEDNAKGCLQREIAAVGSAVMAAAQASRLPAGAALAVDRERFSYLVGQAISAEPRIHLHTAECRDLPSGVTVLATGPLTSDALAARLAERLGESQLAFYDAAAPVVTKSSIDLSVAYFAGRYGQPADYLNCPLDRAAYLHWYRLVSEARSHVPHDFEHLEFFEGCMPIEELARRGVDTPRFGPLKPRGLPDPRTGREPYAAVQLRQEDAAGELWSLVGFQTGLKWPDQQGVVRAIPGLERAEIVRYGVMHRNTYLNAPRLLAPSLRLRSGLPVWVAGVLAGTEGYLESAATGWLAGVNAARLALGQEPLVPPAESVLGSLVRYLSSAKSEGFQPMNANWGLLTPLPAPPRGRRERNRALSERARRSFALWAEAEGLLAFRPSLA